MKEGWTAIIPARGGSKGLPQKNVKLLLGKPLYMYSVDVAIAAGAARVIIATDMEEITKVTHHSSVEIYQRSSASATDDAPMNRLLSEVIEQCDISGVTVLLQPTSPLRQVEDVKASVVRFIDETASLVMSVVAAEKSVLKWGLIEDGKFHTLNKPEYCFWNRQALPEVYRPNGAIYVFDGQTFLHQGNFDTQHILPYQMSERDSTDIDSLEDFLKVESYLGNAENVDSKS